MTFLSQEAKRPLKDKNKENTLAPSEKNND